MRQFVLISIFSFLFIHILSGQSPLVTNYRLSDGLPSNVCNCVIKDKEGFLWFGTDAGVIRYDGTSFVIFSSKEGLSSSHVVRIKEDIEGRIWFLFYNGEVNYYYNNHIYNSDNTLFLREIKTNFLFHDFFQNNDSTIYLYNNASEIYAIKHDKYIDYSANEIKGRGLLNISKNKNGNLLLWENDQIKEISSLNKTIHTYSYGFTFRRAYTMKNGHTYVCEPNGNIHLFKNTKLVKKNILRIQSYFVNYILEDNGYLWISTYDKGVFCYKGDSLLLHLDIEKSQNLIADNQNNIWAVSSIYGIYKIDKNILKYKTIGVEMFDNSGIRNITSSCNKGIWVSNRKSIFWIGKNYKPIKLDLNSSKKDLPNGISYIKQLKNGDIITYGYYSQICKIKNVKVDTSNNKITYSDENKITEHINVRGIEIDTTESYLYFFLNNYVVTMQLKEPLKKFVMCYDKIGRINNIIINKHNEVLVNAPYNRIISGQKRSKHRKIYDQFNGKTITQNSVVDKDQEFFLINQKDIFLIAKDKTYNILKIPKEQINSKIKNLFYCKNILFFNTVKTLYFITNPLDIINQKEIKLSQLDIDFDNINDIYCNDNTIYVASNKGLTCIPFNELIKTTSVPTKPYFTKVSLNGNEIDISRGNIHYKNKNRLTIEFSSLNFSPNASHYAYKLEGFNNEWITGDEKQVTFLNLKPGDYNFKLKSKRNFENYSETIELPIEVIPDFFQLWITQVAAILLILFLIYLAIRFRYRHIIKSKEKDNQLITLENRALQAQMNPHFIFNSLGSIQKYLLQNKAEEAGNYLSQFARLIRQTLNSTKSNSVLLEDEIDRLRNYIELEQLRMDNRFDFNINTDEDLLNDNYLIPSMIIQPIVENAIWHGISPLPEKGLITIRFIYINDEKLRIIVEDNGIGFKKSKAFSKSINGLNMASEITQKRLLLIGEKYGVKTEFNVYELYPGNENPGAKVSLTVPFLD